MLSPNRDLVAARQFLRLALWRSRPIRPRVINVDGHPAYARAIADLKATGELGRRCRCRPVAYLNNIVEQDHRFIKKRIAASLWFRSVQGAMITIAGYETMHMIRKGQVKWLAKNDVSGPIYSPELRYHCITIPPSAGHSFPFVAICDRTPVSTLCAFRPQDIR